MRSPAARSGGWLTMAASARSACSGACSPAACRASTCWKATPSWSRDASDRTTGAPSRCRSRTRWCARPRWSPPRCGTDWRAAPRLRPRPRRPPGPRARRGSGRPDRRGFWPAVSSAACTGCAITRRTGAPDGGFCAGRISSTWGAIPRGDGRSCPTTAVASTPTRSRSPPMGRPTSSSRNSRTRPARRSSRPSASGRTVP